MRTRALLFVLLLVGSLYLVPGPSDVLVPAAGAEPVQTGNVTMSGNAFVPNDIIVLRGTTVRWVNEDGGTVHSVHSDTDAWTPRDPILPPEFDDTPLTVASVTFQETGVFNYHCSYHESQNMVGRITVVDSFEAPNVSVSANDDNVFVPDFVNISIDQNLTWTNVGTNQHNVVFEEDAIGKVGELGAGETLLLAFTQTGVYRYRCTYHSLDDFQTGMVGKVSVDVANPQFPPTVQISSPAENATVSGAVRVIGSATTGLGNVSVTGVEVRIGLAGAWSSADLGDESGQTISWTYDWDTTTADNGAQRVYARALSEEFPDPTPTWVAVIVDHVAAANATTTAPGEDDGGGTPGFGVAAAHAGLLVAATLILRGRRRR